MGLPGTDLGQLKKQAKDWLRKGRANDPEALELLRRLHPRGDALAADPAQLQLADAQLALARAYGFASWPRLREHIELVTPWRRTPHRVGARPDLADELLRLACLTYGADNRQRPAQAAGLLAEHPELAGASLATAAATGDVTEVTRHLATPLRSTPRPARSVGRHCSTSATAGCPTSRPSATAWSAPGCCSMPAPTRMPATSGKGWRRPSPR